MQTTEIVPGVYQSTLGMVNVFFMETDASLVLIDTASRGYGEDILAIARQISPKEVKHIILTHCHPDHVGSLAELKRMAEAQSYAHLTDAALIRTDVVYDPSTDRPRRFVSAPGMDHFFAELSANAIHVEGAPVDQEIQEEDTFDFLPNLEIIHTPGHCAGQVALLWHEHGGILFAADTYANVNGLGWSIGYEDFAEGKRSLKKLCNYDFEIAVFGHGDPIPVNAGDIWRRKWRGV